MAVEPHPTRAIIHRGAFLHNIGCVRSYCGPHVTVMAVVKANAYGHGIIELSRLAVEAGVNYLSVARVDEALEIRRAGIHHPVLVFEIPPAGHITPALEADIELTVSALGGGRAISAAAVQSGRTARIHVKVDTGMGRLGLGHPRAVEEIEALVRLPGLVLGSVYSHFATADDDNKAFARDQLRRYLDVVGGLEARGIHVPCRHIANSAAIMTMPESYLDMVRPGIMLYGYTPAQGIVERFPVQPVLSLVSSIALLKSVEAGASISYGRKFVARERTTIATVPLGYADGYSRLLTGRTWAIVRGRRYPVVGTICMDQIMVDLGDSSTCEEGDTVTLIGGDGTERITAWDVARTIGTIPYEVTSNIAARVPRIYADGK